jgi:hypothetical protein
LLRPEAGSNHWSDFSQVEEALASGRREVEQFLPELRKLIRKKSWTRLFHGRQPLQTRRNRS